MFIDAPLVHVHHEPLPCSTFYLSIFYINPTVALVVLKRPRPSLPSLSSFSSRLLSRSPKTVALKLSRSSVPYSRPCACLERVVA